MKQNSATGFGYVRERAIDRLRSPLKLEIAYCSRFTDNDGYGEEYESWLTPSLSHKLKIGAWMKRQFDLSISQSPAGRAPTLLIRIVGARPAGDVRNPQK
jgi:hypothetical protein